LAIKLDAEHDFEFDPVNYGFVGKITLDAEKWCEQPN
jgi:hypothetical protein